MIKRIVPLILSMVLTFGLTVSAGAASVDIIYDPDTGLTWLKDAGMGGMKNWSEAVNWANDLVYAGYSDWQLPTSDSICGTGYNCTESEMGHIYYTELGNLAAGGLSYTGPFSNLQPSGYWSGTVDASNPDYKAWIFNFFLGYQDVSSKDALFYAWAVRSDASSSLLRTTSVPEPGTIVLLGSGLAGIVVLRKRQG